MGNHSYSASEHAQAIHTTYNGFRFRSRTEARWAVFFDEMGVEYDYETQSYWLPKLQCGYLPDFYLPEVRPKLNYISDCFIEIKSVARDKEKAKCEQLAIGTEKHVFLLEGRPHQHQITGWSPRGHEHGEIYMGYRYGTLSLCPTCVDREKDQMAKISEAIRVAKQARFEFGETPRP